MPKPERNFITRIHRKLDPELYKQAMGLTSTNGTPDYYYEGLFGFLWVEYKWYEEKPEVIDLLNVKKKPHLSALQQNWLKRAEKNKIPTAVIAGYPQGCFILKDSAWQCMIFDTTPYEYPIMRWIKILNELQRSTKDRW